MTKEQQEAKGLIDKFRAVGASLWDAKKYAIIAASEIIRVLSTNSSELYFYEESTTYWETVIDEIPFQS